MTTPNNFVPSVAITKKEFKLVHKNMKFLMKKLEKFINESLDDSCWKNKDVRPKISIDMSTFRQAWGTVKIGKCPVYGIIHINNKDDSMYLALEGYLASKIEYFCIKYHFQRIYNSILKGTKPAGKRKDRIKANNSQAYPWFGIAVRGATNPESNNFRIVVKSERVFVDEDNLGYYSSCRKEEENND